MSPDRREDNTVAIGPGTLFLVVGPSGAGKDALIKGARTALAGDNRFIFPERVITRASHAAEAHASVDEAEFVEAMQHGAFALTWPAHELRYGVPVTINAAIGAGQAVVVNASRGICIEARRRYARTRVILVDCPRDVRAARLSLRKRESAAEIDARLERNVVGFEPTDADAMIDNSGTIDDGVRRLTAALRRLIAPA
ncbi:MAG: phosphonate metabolism protein/1,5-bisphosphokinase (PRPP-forming) PhnN [Hyphomicrobiaceae bacterium]